MKPANHRQEISKCCGAPCYADSEGEGTFTMVCTKCKKDCDVIIGLRPDIHSPSKADVISSEPLADTQQKDVILARIKILERVYYDHQMSIIKVGMREMLDAVEQEVNDLLMKSQVIAETGHWINGSSLKEKLATLREAL